MKSRFLVITGTNGQIGSYLAKHYAKKGNPLLLLYHKRSERIDEMIGKPNILLQSCDLCSLEQVRNSLQTACDTWNAVPGWLIHTAAVRSYDAKSLSNSDPRIFQEVLLQNVMAAYNILHTSLPLMQENQFGRIVMFGSDVVESGLAKGSAYSAAKAAIVNLVKSVALETASSNIMINALSPAPVETALEEDYQGEYLDFRKRYFADYIKKSPFGKLVDKDKIRDYVEQMLNDSLEDFSGNNIMINASQAETKIETLKRQNETV